MIHRSHSTSNTDSRNTGLFGDGTEEVLQPLLKFDARLASCFKQEDRDHLLGVIESGFGDFDGFNKIVRGWQGQEEYPTKES